MKILKKNQKGFTLVEVSIALFVFAVGIMALTTMQIASIEGNSKGRQISESAAAGADRIERFISMPYDDVALLDVDGDGTNQDTDNTGIDDDGEGNPIDGITNFGLDHATAATADATADSDGDGTPDIFWNVAVDHPLPKTKTIKIFVAPSGNGRNIEMTIVKADI